MSEPMTTNEAEQGVEALRKDAERTIDMGDDTCANATRHAHTILALLGAMDDNTGARKDDNHGRSATPLGVSDSDALWDGRVPSRGHARRDDVGADPAGHGDADRGDVSEVSGDARQGLTDAEISELRRRWRKGNFTLTIAAVERIIAARERQAGAAVLREAIGSIQAVYDIQCPVGPPDGYVDKGAHMAHQWWQTVLGSTLRDLTARAERLEAGE